MQLRHLVLAVLMISSVSLQALATNCRSASAAQAGAKTGYERNRNAAEAWSDRENQVSSGLQQCLGSISSAITVPTFPDLSGILSGIKDKICKAARDKIQEYVPSQIDPWGDLSSRTKGLVNTTSKTVSAPQSYSPTAYSPAPAPPSSASGGDYIFTR
jgi:TraL protein